MSNPVRIMRWIGGKSRLSTQLRAVMDVEHSVFAEPFLGGGGFFLNRSVIGARQIINDLDDGIYSIWRVIGSDRYHEFANNFSNFPISDDVFRKFKGIRKKGFPCCSEMEKALMTYYLTVYSFNGGTRNMEYGHKPEEWEEMRAKALRRLRSSLERAHFQASNSEIYNTDARVIIAAYKDNPDALIYIDSPYVYELMGDMKNPYNTAFTTEDQISLLTLIRDAKAKVCVSGYRGGSLLYDRYLNRDTDWHVYKIGEVTRSAGMYTAIKGDTHNKVSEFVWTNYEVPAKASFFVNTFDLALTYGEIAEYQAKVA